MLFMIGIHYERFVLWEWPFFMYYTIENIIIIITRKVTIEFNDKHCMYLFKNWIMWADQKQSINFSKLPSKNTTEAQICFLFVFNSLSSFPQTLKNCHFEHKHQILEKNHFWMHVTIEFCSTLVWKDVGKFSEFSTMWIARY